MKKDRPTNRASIISWASLRAMRFAFTFLLVSLMVIGCHRRDASFQKIVGAWQTQESGWDMTFSPNGGFVSGSPSLTFQGTWLVVGDEIVMTVTNATGTKKHEPVGSIDRLRIIGLDGQHMTLVCQVSSNYLATNIWIRKP